MEDPDGGLSFDFEGNLDSSALPSSAPSAANLPSAPSTAASAPSSGADPTSIGPVGGGRRGSFRQTVCRHWLRGLCMKGDLCGFLHQYDKARMPVCRFFRLYGECREQDCVYKHSEEDFKECNMYKMGFCPNGPDCRYRHAKLPGPPPPVEEVFQKIQQMFSYNYGPQSRFFPKNSNFNNNSSNNNHNNNNNTNIPNGEKQQPTQGSQNAMAGGQQQTPSQTNQQTQLQQGSQNGVPGPPVRTASPLPQGPSRYFIVKSSNRENLEISVQQGVWATQRSNEAKLNEAFESTDNVILLFSINRTRHFQGCAKMTSRIGGYVGGGNWKYAHGTAHYGRNFSVKWLKLGELSFNKTHHLRNPYNDNLPVKISRDCQELEPSIGEQLTSLLYLEPDSELMAMLVEAEQKREEEKSKGGPTNGEAASAGDNNNNQDIVLFDENEEEDEEEESDEDDDQSVSRARGRAGANMLPWQPHMPPRGPAALGLRGFPPAMMGPSDGFGFGLGPGDGFGMPELFGMPPRVFPPFGGPRPGPMVFPGMRPGQPGPPMFPMGGLGMMMGPGGRGAPFMGLPGGMPMGALGRPNRPMGMPPFAHHPPGGANRAGKRDQRKPVGDRQENGPERRDPDAGTDHEMEYQHGGGRNESRDEGSESEEEVGPRRHREGKRRRRGSDSPSSDHRN
ncbi:cleavage and polyadenylation specificity factor 30 [Rhynchospora pubera]|uniref:Cleavage and polyadenylation specificity factor 30 n=1 Tax=Rhynchospora pubera TaxID=906938 RepID=A0AAV8H386_9POAL|nr:cleavage and polyadenylation specificity factor 30 [Rhynchospora pubera]